MSARGLVFFIKGHRIQRRVTLSIFISFLGMCLLRRQFFSYGVSKFYKKNYGPGLGIYEDSEKA